MIVGLGDVGLVLAEALSHEPDHDLVLIDSDAEACEHAAGVFDALVLHGDASDPDLLRKAQLDEADALVAATGTDATNTVVAMLGRHFGVRQTFVKLNEAGLASACTEIGVTRIITPKISAAAEIRDALYGLASVDLSTLARGGMRLVELEAPALDGRTLQDYGLPRGALVISVRRGHDVLYPHPDLLIEGGDTLLFIVENGRIGDELRDLVGGR